MKLPVQIVIVSIVLAISVCLSAQTTGRDLEIALRSAAELTDDDISALQRGEPVVKVLKGKEKKQIGVCGIVLLRNVPEVSMDLFRESLTQKANKSVLAGGKFGTPPATGDVSALRLDENDFKDLSNCAPGDCKLKLPAEMITQLRSAVDDSTQTNVTWMFGQYLVAYAADYLAHGDRALAQYDNEKEPVRLADEHRMLLGRSPLIDGLAPEFVKYLAGFPDTELTGIESSVDWTKVTFGFKPFITVTHSISYDRTGKGALRYLIATRQIYASRYVDASLAMSMFLRFEGSDGTAEDYLIFTDISRSDALGGALSGIKRSVVGADATARVKELLERSRSKLEAGGARNNIPEREPDPPGLIAGIRARLGDALSITLLGAVLGALVYFIVQKLRR